MNLQDRMILLAEPGLEAPPEEIDVFRIHVGEDEIQGSILVEIGGPARLPDADSQPQIGAARRIVAVLAAPENSSRRGQVPMGTSDDIGQVQVAVPVQIADGDSVGRLHFQLRLQPEATGAAAEDGAVRKDEIDPAILVQVGRRRQPPLGGNDACGGRRVVVSGVPPIDHRVDGAVGPAVLVDDGQVLVSVLVQVAGGQAHGSEALELPAVGGVKSIGTVPVEIGGHIAGRPVVAVGKSQVDPTVPVVIGQHGVGGGQRGKFLASAGGVTIFASPVNIGRLTSAVSQNQVGAPVPVQVSHSAVLRPLGGDLDPGLPGDPLPGSLVNRHPVVLVREDQIRIPVPGHLRQSHSDGVSLLPRFARRLETLRPAPVQDKALVLRIVVGEEEIAVAVMVEVRRRHVSRAGGGQCGAVLFPKTPGTVPVDVGLQVEVEPETLTPFDAPVGEGEIDKAVSVEVRRRHPPGQKRGKLGAMAPLVAVRAAPIDEGHHVNRIVVNEVAEDQLRIAVVIQVHHQGTAASVTGQTGDPLVANPNLPQQPGQRLMAGQRGHYRFRPPLLAPIDQDVGVFQGVVVLDHQEIQVAVVVQVPTVGHLQLSRSGDVEIGPAVGDPARGEVLETGVGDPTLVVVPARNRQDQSRQDHQCRHHLAHFTTPSMLGSGQRSLSACIRSRHGSSAAVRYNPVDGSQKSVDARRPSRL